MNTNLEQVLTETIVSSKKAVGEAVEWALEQVPDICDQYLKYEMISTIINACLFAIVITLVVIGHFKLWKLLGAMYNKDSEDRIISRTVAGLLAGVVIFCISTGFVATVKQAVKIYVAPKVYLVEFAAKLVK